MIRRNFQDKLKQIEVQTRAQSLLPRPEEVMPGADTASGGGFRMGRDRRELTFLIDLFGLLESFVLYTFLFPNKKKNHPKTII